MSEASPSPERVRECVHCFTDYLDNFLHVLSGLFFLNMMYVNMLGCLDFMDEIGMFGVSDGMELHMIIG